MIPKQTRTFQGFFDFRQHFIGICCGKSGIDSMLIFSSEYSETICMFCMLCAFHIPSISDFQAFKSDFLTRDMESGNETMAMQVDS